MSRIQRREHEKHNEGMKVVEYLNAITTCPISVIARVVQKLQWSPPCIFTLR